MGRVRTVCSRMTMRRFVINKQEDVKCIAEVRLGHSVEAVLGLSVAVQMQCLINWSIAAAVRSDPPCR